MNTIVSRCQVLSLKKENKLKEENIDTKTLLVYSSFHNQEDIDNFLNNGDTEDKIASMVEYIKKKKKNGYQAIIYKNKPFLEKFNDKKMLYLVFQWFILYYKDVLNHLLGKRLEFFQEYVDDIHKVSESNSTLIICKKLEILLELSEKIKFNVNATMLMDKLVIDLMEVK